MTDSQPEHQHINCSTCGLKNVPDWDGKGHCITCARDAALGTDGLPMREPLNPKPSPSKGLTKLMQPDTPVGYGNSKNVTDSSDEQQNKVIWWLSKLQVETVKNHRPVMITREDQEVLEKAAVGIEALIARKVAEGQLAKLKEMQEYWYARDGVLEPRPNEDNDWVGADLYDRIAELQQLIKAKQ